MDRIKNGLKEALLPDGGNPFRACRCCRCSRLFLTVTRRLATSARKPMPRTIHPSGVTMWTPTALSSHFGVPTIATTAAAKAMTGGM